MMSLFILLLLLTNRFQCAVHCRAEPVDHHVDVFGCRDVGRCQQNMVATAAIRRAAGRITGEAVFERGGLDPLVELEAGIERLAAGAIGDELDGLEQAASADVADVPVIAEALRQSSLEVSAEIPDPLEQFLFSNDPLHLKRRRAGEGVREISMSVLESSDRK